MWDVSTATGNDAPFQQLRRRMGGVRDQTHSPAPWLNPTSTSPLGDHHLVVRQRFEGVVRARIWAVGGGSSRIAQSLHSSGAHRHGWCCCTPPRNPRLKQFLTVYRHLLPGIHRRLTDAEALHRAHAPRSLDPDKAHAPEMYVGLRTLGPLPAEAPKPFNDTVPHGARGGAVIRNIWTVEPRWSRWHAAEKWCGLATFSGATVACGLIARASSQVSVWEAPCAYATTT